MGSLIPEPIHSASDETHGVTHVLALPASLNAHAIDALAARFAEVPGDERLLVDASQVRSADPFGMPGLLVLGQAASEGRDRPVLVLPETRVGATRFADMEVDGAAREVFAFEPSRWNRSTGGWGPITPLRSHEDVLRLIDGLSERAGEILMETVGYRGTDAILFLMVFRRSART
ncbi:MAG: hypothetical protein H0X52_02070 [Gemmatimonadetes bacterium]|nr:hypothetical protein [Gemmatimonadota bacterium]